MASKPPNLLSWHVKVGQVSFNMTGTRPLGCALVIVTLKRVLGLPIFGDDRTPQHCFSQACERSEIINVWYIAKWSHSEQWGYQLSQPPKNSHQECCPALGVHHSWESSQCSVQRTYPIEMLPQLKDGTSRFLLWTVLGREWGAIQKKSR